MPKLTAIICLFLLSLGALSERSHAQETSKASKFTEFFVGACLRALLDIERMKAAARVMEWKPLNGDVAAMIAPVDPNAEWQGWAVPEGDDLFMFGVSEGSLGSRKASICTTSAGELDQERLVQELQASLNLKLIVDETDALQRARGWETSIDGQKLIVNLTTLSNSRMSPITLAGIAVSQ